MTPEKPKIYDPFPPGWDSKENLKKMVEKIKKEVEEYNKKHPSKKNDRTTLPKI